MSDHARASYPKVFGTTATILGFCLWLALSHYWLGTIFGASGLPTRRDEYFTFPFESKSLNFRFGWTGSGNGPYVGLLSAVGSL
jgi:hypothetical protein